MLVEPVLDVGREHVAPAGRSHAERDRHREFVLVADRERDPLHAELLGTCGGPPVQAHRRLAGRQPLDLDVAPADAADAQPEHLRDGLLGGPAPGHRARPAAHVALFGRRQDPRFEARPESLERAPDAPDADDVDAELGRPGRHRGDGGDRRGGRSPVRGRHRSPTRP